MQHNVPMSVAEHEIIRSDPARPARRVELASFLRSRRARLVPEEVGLIPGRRRHIPGLRREEVAQLASVGVTWYTWLEQGRPINVSREVVDSIGRALRLDPTEREHLFLLADVPIEPADRDAPRLDAEVQVVLDGLDPFPATVITSRYDVLAWNAAYGAFFPGLVGADPEDRNILWQLFANSGQCALCDPEPELERMVATLRGAFARHVGEVSWVQFVARLEAVSPRFAELWDRHDVAEPVNRLKRFRMVDGTELRMYATSLAVTGTPETRMVVYTPVDDISRGYLAQHAGHPSAEPAAS